MEELTKEDLKLFFDKEIYLIKESSHAKPRPDSTPVEPASEKAETPVVEEPLPQPISLVHKGENAKGIALIITDDANEFLNTADETLLLNILKAIGLSLEDVAIINQHRSGTEWQTQINFNKAIVFGILPSTYGVVTENYTIQQKGDAQWLFSDSLFSLASDKVLKGKLWGKLQELF